MIDSMGKASTESAYFMETLINEGNRQVTSGSESGERPRKSFSNINVDTNSGKPTILSKKGVMINSNNIANLPEEISKSLMGPKFPRQPGNTNSLINTTNRYGVRIKVRNPRTKNKVQILHKPRSIDSNIIFVRNRSKPKKHPPIFQFNVFNLPLNTLPVKFSLCDNKGQGEDFTPYFSKEAKRNKFIHASSHRGEDAEGEETHQSGAQCEGKD